MPYKAENWHAVSHEQYFSTYHYLDICPESLILKSSFFGFLTPDLSAWGYRSRCFLVAMIVRRPTMAVATKRFLHQQLKIRLFLVVCQYSYFWWCGYFLGPLMSFVTTDKFSVRVTKITSRIGFSWTHSIPLWFWPLFNSVKWPSDQKHVNQINLKQTTLWNLALPIFEVFVWILLNGNLSLSQISWYFLFELCGTNLDDSIDWQFLREGLFSFNPKEFCYSYAWSCSLYKGRTSVFTGFISRKLCGFLFKFSIDFTSFSVLLLFPLWTFFFIFMHDFWCYFIKHKWGSLDQCIC